MVRDHFCKNDLIPIQLHTTLHLMASIFSVSYSWKYICFIFLRIYAVARQNGSNAKFILEIYMFLKIILHDQMEHERITKRDFLGNT